MQLGRNSQARLSAFHREEGGLDWHYPQTPPTRPSGFWRLRLLLAASHWGPCQALPKAGLSPSPSFSAVQRSPCHPRHPFRPRRVQEGQMFQQRVGGPAGTPRKLAWSNISAALPAGGFPVWKHPPLGRERQERPQPAGSGREGLALPQPHGSATHCSQATRRPEGGGSGLLQLGHRRQR